MAWQSDILIEAGTTFELDVELTDEDGNPLDTTGYSACSQIREHRDSANSSADFSTGLSNGSLTLVLTANATGTLETGRYLWDAKITDTSTGIVTRIIEGVVTVSGSVAR